MVALANVDIYIFVNQDCYETVKCTVGAVLGRMSRIFEMEVRLMF